MFPLGRKNHLYTVAMAGPALLYQSVFNPVLMRLAALESKFHHDQISIDVTFSGLFRVVALANCHDITLGSRANRTDIRRSAQKMTPVTWPERVD